MGHKLTLGVDVDLTLLDPVQQNKGWLNYLNRLSKQHNYTELSKDCPYNLKELYTDLSLEECMAYWSTPDLYQRLIPYDNCVEVIQRLSKKMNIIFLSRTKSGHFKSKDKFLKDNFKLPTDEYCFCAVHEKGKLSRAIDIMVDDRLDILNQFGSCTDCLLYDTIYTQTVDAERRVKVVKDWLEIEKYINEVYLDES